MAPSGATGPPAGMPKPVAASTAMEITQHQTSRRWLRVPRGRSRIGKLRATVTTATNRWIWMIGPTSRIGSKRKTPSFNTGAAPFRRTRRARVAGLHRPADGVTLGFAKKHRICVK